MRLNITGDDNVTHVYVDGVLQRLLLNSDNWRKVDTIAIPADSRVVAVRGHDLYQVSSCLLWYRRVISVDRPCSGCFDERNHSCSLCFQRDFSNARRRLFAHAMILKLTQCTVQSLICFVVVSSWVACEQSHRVLNNDTRCYVNVHLKADVIYHTEPKKTKKLQTDKHASTPPLSFLQAGCPSCRPTNSVKALKCAVKFEYFVFGNKKPTQKVWTNITAMSV